MKEPKRINCTLTEEQLRDLGEPIAYFTMKLPKEAKNLGKQASKERVGLEAICVQPERGKIIASDAHILTAMGVDCEGVWPDDKDGKTFECFIDPKAISSLAGKLVDIAVWTDYKGAHDVTACEATGVCSQYQLTNAKYPNWEKVMPTDDGCNIVMAESALETLRKFVKSNMGKTKKEREKRYVVFGASKEADDVMIQIVDETEEYSNEYTLIAKEQFDIKSNYPEHDIRMAFNAELFYYSVQEDFNGSIWFRNENSPVKFNGKMRESILMPMQLWGGYEPYFK